jgi:hypothetical protein
VTTNDSGDFDEGVLRALRELALRDDPVPGEVKAAAEAAFSWRTIDADLASLTYDSLLDEERLIGVRGPGGPRQLTFEGAGLTMEVEVGDDRAVIGQLVPPSTATVELRWPGGATAVEADDLGRFGLPPAPRGPVSLRCLAAGGAAPVTTDWLTL